MFVLPEPAREAGAMSCPACAANVGAADTRCSFCQAQLLLKACPRCFARIFHGAKHCDQCGAKVEVPAAVNADGTARDLHCPRCDGKMFGRLAGNVLLDECNDCHGIWMDAEALTRVLEDRESNLAMEAGSAPRSGQYTAVADPGLSGGRMYVKCPECDVVMNRKSFARGSRVIIDQCKSHGTWFDAGELPRVVEFVSSGGLGEARKREMAELKDQERRNHSKAMAVAMTASRGGGNADGFFERRSPILAALGIIAKTVFDK